ncbi:hypothetical protein DYI24_02505 [Rhodopseudomonas sp. BR0C11]|uniref:hypothetical protein n=1 Tax=Rhodopseudomonas sp. BR0C11 TaxID=2269370 RepID=UPI0013DFF42F|nr:hypothetical protein [Rhodopseudomonas sp. BR0C11]NEV75916.1 hypothetical protein [Rhodopseudomonas sp. BR0C11]
MTVRNPRYDGLYVFKLNLAAMQPGDVFLTRNAEASAIKGKLTSSLIALFSRGDFSHALMCTVPPTLIEAIGDGVSNLSAQTCFVHDLRHIRVLRYPNQAVAKLAASAAMKFFAKGYSVARAIASVLPGRPQSLPGDEGIFCSALIAAAFRAAGATEFAATHPLKVTPAWLQKSPHFQDVTDSICTRILSPSNIEEMSALDGVRIPSPLAGQSALFRSYFNTLSAPIAELLAAHPTLTECEPTTFFELLEFISSLCRATSRLPDGQAERDVKCRVARIDELAAELLSEGSLRTMEDAAEARDEESIRYTLTESFKPNPDINFDDLVGMVRSTRSQIASRSSVLDDPERPPGHSMAWDEWEKHTRQSLVYFERRLSALTEALQRAFPTPTANTQR